MVTERLLRYLSAVQEQHNCFDLGTFKGRALRLVTGSSPTNNVSLAYKFRIFEGPFGGGGNKAINIFDTKEELLLYLASLTDGSN